MAQRRMSITNDKTVRLTYAVWRKARICAIEADVTLHRWVADAIVMKADLQEKSGKMTRQGVRVAASAPAVPKT